MAVFDDKFRRNKVRYVGQCLLATLSILLVLLVLGVMTNAAVVASLGATGFIAFTMPHRQACRPRYILGGYLVGAAVGSACHALAGVAWPAILSGVEPQVIFGALAVGLAIFLMVVTNTEHPPAAGLALGLVLSGCSVTIVAVSLAGVVGMLLVQRALKRFLIDLL